MRWLGNSERRFADTMNLSKAHSVNFYISIFAFVGLMMLLVIGLNMFREIGEVEATFKKSHHDYAEGELARAVDSVLVKTREITDRLAQWDETSQQLTDPTYYRFWRQRRIQTLQFVPDYVNLVELYNKNGKSLLKPRVGFMPSSVPDQKTQIILHNNRPWLLYFQPVMLYQNSSEVFGFVGVGVDFFAALLELNLFTHLDSSSLSVGMVSNSHILPSNLLSHINYTEFHAAEQEQLKQITYTTFAYIVGLVLFIFIIIYWMVIALFAKPLTRLNKHIESIKQSPAEYFYNEHLSRFPLTEFNNFMQSLQQYQLNLHNTQNNLKRLNNDLEQRVIERTSELQLKNKELESFSYSVSHDLRAPLRSIDGFTQILQEDYIDKIDDEGRNYLERVRSNTRQMGELIDDLLDLARISQLTVKKSNINITNIAQQKINQLKEINPGSTASFFVEDNLHTIADPHLVGIVLNNLIENAWKYSSKVENPVITIGKLKSDQEPIFYVKDNGAGFDMKYVDKIFNVFNRLHGKEFEGTGIGLATVSRILSRHGGRIWAEAKPNEGACFYFTLDAQKQKLRESDTLTAVG